MYPLRQLLIDQNVARVSTLSKWGQKICTGSEENWPGGYVDGLDSQTISQHVAYLY